MVPIAPRRHEAVETTLAKNLVLARLAEGVTQKELATASDVSRATIAQLETGVSDPRVSTVADLARALGLPAAFLLLSAEEIEALVRLVDEIRAHPIEVRPEEAARIRELLRTGMLRDRNRANPGRFAGRGGAGGDFQHRRAEQRTRCCRSSRPARGR